MRTTHELLGMVVSCFLILFTFSCNKPVTTETIEHVTATTAVATTQQSNSPDQDISRTDSNTGDIRVELVPGLRLSSQTVQLEEGNIITGILSADYHNDAGNIYKEGEPCLLVNVVIQNMDTVAWQMYFYAEGYTSDGATVSWTLDQGPTLNSIVKTIPPNSSASLTFHLNWAEKVALIKIFVSGYNTLTPIP